MTTGPRGQLLVMGLQIPTPPHGPVAERTRMLSFPTHFPTCSSVGFPRGVNSPGLD